MTVDKPSFDRNMGFMAKSVRFRLVEASVVLRLYALIAALAAMSTSGCGTSHATLDFIAPSAATAGTQFTVTVNVLYQGKPHTVINSPIHFTSSVPAAVLPPNYYFKPRRRRFPHLDQWIHVVSGQANDLRSHLRRNGKQGKRH